MANIENSWMRRKVLIHEDILEVYAALKGKDQAVEQTAEEKTEESSLQSEEKPAANEAAKQCQEAQPAPKSEEGAPATQQTESTEEEKARLIACLLKPNASGTECSAEAEAKKEKTMSVGNDDKVDFDVNFCIN